MARTDGVDLRLEFLSIARGMDHVVDLVVGKDRQLGRRIADPVVALPHRLGAQEAVGGGEQGLVAHVGDRAHLA